ncbi:RNA polymerase sigma factor [Planctomycetes bacterium MalM25]|nr:RNA polymerase sigma factor [Planctomycetes bacterium MalM25]
MPEAITDPQFIELLTANQMRLRSFALALAPFGADADDALQSSCLKMWEKRDKYDPGRAFLPWACGFVRLEVLRIRRERVQENLLFDEELISTLAIDYVEDVARYDARREQLWYCVKKLPEKDRNLLSARYLQNAKPKEISKEHGAPLTTIYSALARIRKSLHRCVEAFLAQQTHVEG